MQHFYDGQIRRYLVQTIRVLSNFVVKYGDGSLIQVPVMYGDADRQAANIIQQNSENTLNSVPRIAVYISGLDLDRDRLGDSSHVGKVHIRERDINNGEYTQGQGRNYTVERLMPTPFKLTIKCDIWTANTDQKLQLLEQILVLFNPSLELQTTENYLDWTSLSILNLTNVMWSSRQVPVGANSPIDIATLTFETPIWISPPAKVKHLGVITKIITSIYQGSETTNNAYIDGLGQPLVGPETTLSRLVAQEVTTVTDYAIQVYNGQIVLLGKDASITSRSASLEIDQKQGATNWQEVFEQYPGKFNPGSSTIFLLQPDGAEIVGSIAINPLDNTVLSVNWDADTYRPSTFIDTNGYTEDDQGFDQNSARSNFDAIINPTKVYPENGITDLDTGDRFLIVDDIIDTSNNEQGASAWGGFTAEANDIIEWSGTEWHIIFDSSQESDTLLWQTNIYTGVQYKWNGVSWSKSFEGDYKVGEWRIEL